MLRLNVTLDRYFLKIAKNKFCKIKIKNFQFFVVIFLLTLLDIRENVTRYALRNVTLYAPSRIARTCACFYTSIYIVGNPLTRRYAAPHTLAMGVYIERDFICKSSAVRFRTVTTLE